MRIIFVTDQYPLSPRDDNRFGQERLAGKGHQVVHWNVSRLTGSKSDRVKVPQGSKSCRLEIDNLQHLRYLLSSLSRRDVVVCVGLTNGFQSISQLMVLRTVGQSAAYFTGLFVNNIPRADGSYPLFRRTMQGLRNFRGRPSQFTRAGFILLDRTGLLRPFLRILGFQSFNAIWVGPSLEGSLLRALNGFKTNVHYIHNLDYDRVLGMEQHPDTLVSEPYFVLLGGLGPLHPDFRNSDQGAVDQMLPVGAWNVAMNDALDAIARKTKLKAVVAIHPRSIDRHLEHIYTRQTVFRDKTPELVRDAKFVLTYDGSTAVSFAVMLAKPLIFARWEHLTTAAEISLGLKMAGLLGAPVISSSGDWFDWSLLSVNKTAYQNYVEKFVKKKLSPQGKFFWDVVLERLNEKF